MHYIKAFLTFWYDFIVGDDWTIAASIAAAIAVTLWLVQSNIDAWWLLPAVAILTLGFSLWRGAQTEGLRTRWFARGISREGRLEVDCSRNLFHE